MRLKVRQSDWILSEKNHPTLTVIGTPCSEMRGRGAVCGTPLGLLPAQGTILCFGWATLAVFVVIGTHLHVTYWGLGFNKTPPPSY
jgi:hypothetical protein